MLRRIHSTCLASLLLIPSVGLADTGSYRPDTRSYNVAHGRVVFENRCMRCHESGRQGAPVLGDVDDWRDRLGQSLDTLIKHAIQGHGSMPARGDQQIVDQDIAAAVAFVVDRTRALIAVDEINALPPTAAARNPPRLRDPADQAVVHMFLMLFSQDRWK